MGFTNRWVCKSLVGYDFDEMRKILEKYGKGSVKGDKFDLDYVVKLDSKVVTTLNSMYLPGTLYFERELEDSSIVISDDGNVKRKEDITKETCAVDFDLSDKGIFLFRNRKPETRDGNELLSTILFKESGRIRSLFYDIGRIEEDVKNGVFQGLWTSSFRDRNGNIHSGIVYGENIDNDAIYAQTSGAPRNFIGIEKILDENLVKIKIMRNGSINILKNFDGSSNTNLVYELVEEFLKYAVVSK